jgi:hypothetical protein
MEKTALDLIPWQQQPQLPEQRVHVIEWKGGKLEIPRFGYLVIDELDQIQAVDPKNALYQLTAETSVKLSRASGNLEPRKAFSLLTMLHARDLGARIALSEEEDSYHIEHSGIIGAYLEEALTMANRVIIRSCTVILQRIKSGWIDEMTRQLPQPLISAIYAFEQEEEGAQQVQSDPDAAMRELEKSLGKLAEVSRSIVTVPTGDTSTGNAPGSGQGALSLAAPTSGDSPATTSSRRSKRVTKPKGSGFTAKSEL